MSKKPKATDPARFEGNGISYRAKIIGIEDVGEARGDKMCQETIQKLKEGVKTSGQHKQRVFINITLEGLKIIDAPTTNVLHTHPVHQISFISRDVTDSRAFGYVCGPGDGSHKFVALKTANSSENVVLALRDLFQTVYEMKKQEMEDAKAKATGGTDSQTDDKAGEDKTAAETQPTEGQEINEQVPQNNAPPNPQEQEEAVANLLDLEDQVDTILKGIEQIKKLDFDDLTGEDTSGQHQSSSAATSPDASTATATPATNDPWGLSLATETSSLPATSSSSALSDLEQLSNPAPTSNPFAGVQAFPNSSTSFFGMAQPGLSMPGMSQPGIAQPGMSLTGMSQPGMTQPGMAQAGMPLPGMSQPGMGQPGMSLPGMSQPGMAQPGMSLPGISQPGMTQPGMAQPGMAQFGMAQPGMPQAGVAHSGMAQPGMTQPGMPFGQPRPQGVGGPGVGLPVTKDPFATPFNAGQAQQTSQTIAAPGGHFGLQPGFGSPFSTSMGTPASAQSFSGTMTFPGSTGMQPGFGRASPAFSPFGSGVGMQMAPPEVPSRGVGADPFQPGGDGLLQPSQPGGKEQPRPVSPSQANLFSDLLDIKKSVGAESATKSPKEMFQTLTQPPKKSLNQIREAPAPAAPAPQASVFEHDPFTEDPFGSLDTVLNTIASSEPDPFNSPHRTPPSSSPPPLAPPPLPQPPAPPDPLSAKPHTTLSAPSSKESSPETRFDVPNEPPPPLPAHLLQTTAAPSPPPRPPPIPNRPMPKTQKNSPSKSVHRSFSTPPPLPTTPRPSSSIASSSPASELSTSENTASCVETGRDNQSSRNTSPNSSSCVSGSQAPPSPSHSWSSSGSLSHSSSQKSLERVLTSVDNDDPFGVPLRSKKSFSSADGASKRSSRSSGKLSTKSDSKVSIAVDPFGVPLKDRTSGTEGAGGKGKFAGVDNPFSVPVFSDSISVTSSPSPWDTIGDHAENDVASKKKHVAVPSQGQTIDTSPFGDDFFGAPINGKASDGQS